MKLWRVAAALLLVASAPAWGQGSISGNNGNGIGGNPPFGGGGGTPGGSDGFIQFNNGGTFGGIATTGTGNVVRSTSGSLTNPTISGGTIDGSAIGGTTPAAVSATTLSATGTTTTAGITDSGGINTTSTLGFQIGGNTVVFNALSLGNLFLGSGSPTSSTGGLNTTAGVGAGGSLTTGGEMAAYGNLACALVTTGGFLTCDGQHSMGHETAANFSTAVGNDDQRNLVSFNNNGGNTTVGKGILYTGGAYQFTGVGALAAGGNSANLTVGGTITTTDVINVTFTGSFTGSPTTVNVPMTGLSTTAQAAAAVMAAVNANATLANPSLVDANTVTSGVISGTSSIAFGFIGSGTSGPDILVTATVTGAATETVTITNGFVGVDDIVIGFKAFTAQYATSASRDLSIGDFSLPLCTTCSDFDTIGNGSSPLVTSATQGFVFGSGAAATLTTGSGNLIGGYKADVTAGAVSASVILGGNPNGGASGARCGSNYVCVGAALGSANVTGQRGVLIGEGVGTSVLSSGFQDVLIGWQTDMPAGFGASAGWVNINGAIFAQAFVQTIASGFGTTPVVVNGGTTEAFQVNVGTGGTASAGVVTVSSVPAPHGWACSVVDNTNSATSNTIATPTSSTTVTLTNYSRTVGTVTAWAASDVLTVGPCLGF